MTLPESVDVVVVGAGGAGLRLGEVLQQPDPRRVGQRPEDGVHGRVRGRPVGCVAEGVTRPVAATHRAIMQVNTCTNKLLRANTG